MKTLHQLRQCQTHIIKCLWPTVERLQAIHQHNLAVKAQKMILIEPLHHLLAVIIKALAQHSGIGMLIGLRQFGLAPGIDIRPREELQRGRTCHISRQDKAPRLNKVQPLLFTVVEIIGPRGGNVRQPVFVGRR